MSKRGRASVPVLQDMDQWHKQHIRYKQKVASRRQFEVRFQSLAKQSFDAAFECHIRNDGDDIGKSLAGALMPLTGFSSSDRAQDERWERLIHAEDRPVVLAHIQCVLGGQRDVCVFRVITRSGAVHWFGVLTRPVWDEGGRRVALVYGLVQDHSACTETNSVLADPDAGSRVVPVSFIDRRAIQ